MIFVSFSIEVFLFCFFVFLSLFFSLICLDKVMFMVVWLFFVLFFLLRYNVGNFFLLVSETSVFFSPLHVTFYGIDYFVFYLPFCSHGTMIIYQVLRIPGLCILSRLKKKWIVWFLKVRGIIRSPVC